MTLTTPAWITLDGAVNARVMAPGVLLRSDNLQSLSDRDIRTLVADHDLGTVIDLRADGEVASEGEGPLIGEPGVEVQHHSLYPAISDDAALNNQVVNPWGASHGDAYPDELPVVQTYTSYLLRRPDSVVAAIREIALADHAVLVHCAAGKDRTGVVVAIALDAVGVDRRRIVADYLVTNERVPAILARLLESPTYRDGLRDREPRDLETLPGTMERVLAILDEDFGGSVAWLRRHGLTDDELTALQQRLAPALS